MSHIYPVYILSRVADEISRQCVDAIPRETLGRLLGYRCSWQGVHYVKIVDLVTGEIDSSCVHAHFTHKGIQECEHFLDERYGKNADRPQEVGLFHSHPFGTDPHFSSIDHQTFFDFPYDREGNVFVLVDPISSFFKVFIMDVENQEKCLKQVPWWLYSPQVPS